jgi:hypothetical protein
MIVKRILGESFDLESGAKIPKALVISNGTDELNIPIDDDTAMAVVRLMVGDTASKVVERQPHNQGLFADPPTPTFETTAAVPVLNGTNNGSYDDPDSGVASI